MKKSKEGFGKHLTIILKKMCKVVGAKFDEMDFKDAHWYYKYSWTEKQEKEFIDWMANYLYKNKEARWELCEFPQSRRNKKYYRDGAGQWIWNYGWRVKNEKNVD